MSEDALSNIVEGDPDTPVGDKVADTISLVQKAIEELGKVPPDAQAAAGAIEGAVGDLEAALGLDPALDDQLEGLIGQLVAIARRLASEAIQLAIDEGGNPTVIAESQAYRSEGDALRDAGAPKDAAAEYKDALAKADSA